MSRRRRLAGVDVRHDADVAVIFERMAACHGLYSVPAVAGRVILPAIMREGAVGLGHPVCVFAFLDGGAAIVRRVQDLA